MIKGKHQRNCGILSDCSILVQEQSHQHPPMNNESKWNAMYTELIIYKEKHGNTLVPNRHPKLGAWVSSQRRYYKEMKLGKDTPLTQSRQNKLEQINFVWATKDPRHVPWETRYQELIAYKVQNGNCLVPISYKENVQLANWIATQRQEYRLLRADRQCRITKDKVNMLMDLGFSFDPPRGGARVQKRKSTAEDSDSSIDSRSEASKKVKIPFVPTASNQATPIPIKSEPWIKSFKEYVWHNDNNHIVSSNGALSEWCDNQRIQYILWQTDPKTSELTQDHLNLLTSINFEWEIQSKNVDTAACTLNREVGSKEPIRKLTPDEIRVDAARTLLDLGSSSDNSPEKI